MLKSLQTRERKTESMHSEYLIYISHYCKRYRVLEKGHKPWVVQRDCSVFRNCGFRKRAKYGELQIQPHFLLSIGENWCQLIIAQLDTFKEAKHAIRKTLVHQCFVTNITLFGIVNTEHVAVYEYLCITTRYDQESSSWSRMSIRKSIYLHHSTSHSLHS